MNRVVHLDSFGFLSVTGKDALKFLQGYATSDLEDLGPHTSGIGAICNLQGRMVTSFRVISTDDGFLLRMDRALISVTQAFLSKYIVFSKATMTDVSGELRCFGVFGEAGNLRAGAGARDSGTETETIRVADDRFEVWTRRPDYGDDLRTANIEEWWSAEVACGIAWVTGDTQSEFIPQMFDYHEIGGVDFDKGCYLGQEIIARMHYRGAVNRKLHRGTTSAPVRVGDALTAGDKAIGTVVTSAGTTFLAVVQSKNDVTPECAINGTPVSLEVITR